MKKDVYVIARPCSSLAKIMLSLTLNSLKPITRKCRPSGKLHRIQSSSLASTHVHEALFGTLSVSSS